MERHSEVYHRLAAVRTEAHVFDIILLIHPENVLAEESLYEDFKGLLHLLDTRVLE